MTTPAEVLAANGLLRAPEIVELAAKVGIELAVAATMVQKESGGRNVWGSDAVNTAGIYVKGSEVTREAYLRYKAVRKTIGAQGVGPAQLTWSGYQDQADAIGGCWDWRCNLTVGLQALRDNINRSDLRSGFRAYNGSGPAAEAYADDAMAKLATWRQRLTAAPAPAPAPPRPREDQAMYIRCGDDIAILSGPIFVGLSSQGEHQSALDAIARGAVAQWVERYTWDEILRLRNILLAPGAAIH